MRIFFFFSPSLVVIVLFYSNWRQWAAINPLFLWYCYYTIKLCYFLYFLANKSKPVCFKPSKSDIHILQTNSYSV